MIWKVLGRLLRQQRSQMRQSDKLEANLYKPTFTIAPVESICVQIQDN